MLMTIDVIEKIHLTLNASNKWADCSGTQRKTESVWAVNWTKNSSAHLK